MFETKEAYELAKMNESDRESLQSKIEVFKQRYYSIREDIKNLTTQLEGKKKQIYNNLRNS